MKYYVPIIAFSTVFTLSHFLFRNASVETEWFVRDLTVNVGGISLIMAWVMYITVPYWKVGLKLFCGVYFLLSFLDPIDMFLNHNTRGLWVDCSILGLAILYWILKASHWNLENVQRGCIPVPAGIYIVFRRPHTFLTWFGSLFGFGIGSCYILANGYKYYMTRRTKMLTKAPYVHIASNEFAFELDRGFTEVGLKHFEEALDELIATRFHVIRRNCLSAFAPVLRKYGEKPKTILPSVYFKNFFRNCNKIP